VPEFQHPGRVCPPYEAALKHRRVGNGGRCAAFRHGDAPPLPTRSEVALGEPRRGPTAWANADRRRAGFSPPRPHLPTLRDTVGWATAAPALHLGAAQEPPLPTRSARAHGEPRRGPTAWANADRRRAGFSPPRPRLPTLRDTVGWATAAPALHRGAAQDPPLPTRSEVAPFPRPDLPSAARRAQPPSRRAVARLSPHDQRFQAILDGGEHGVMLKVGRDTMWGALRAS